VIARVLLSGLPEKVLVGRQVWNEG
jgi:hypothetical protein